MACKQHAKIHTIYQSIMLFVRRAAAFGIFLGLFLLAYFIGTLYKMSTDEANNFLNEFHSATSGISAIGIFSHNASVALPMFVPAVGVAWGFFTSWSTGAAFEAIISSNPMLSKMSPLSLLLASPFGIMELVAYSIGMSRSYLVIWKIVKKRGIRTEIVPSAIEVGIVIALLLAGGFIEYSVISRHVAT